MAEAYILEKVKEVLGITGTFQDAALKVHIVDVMGYMESAGVSEARLKAKSSAGVIARGVTDLWANGSGELSNYFKERVIQLTYSGEVKSNE